jgi:hypothetical protein
MPDIQETWTELTPYTCQVLICGLQEEIVAAVRQRLLTRYHNPSRCSAGSLSYSACP